MWAQVVGKKERTWGYDMIEAAFPFSWHWGRLHRAILPPLVFAASGTALPDGQDVMLPLALSVLSSFTFKLQFDILTTLFSLENLSSSSHSYFKAPAIFRSNPELLSPFIHHAPSTSIRAL